MKQLKFFSTLGVVAGMLFFTSCNSGENNNSQTSTDTSSKKTADTTSSQTLPTQTSTGPVSIMSIMHKVADFNKWKPAYDSHDSSRMANGLHNYVVARGVEDSNMVMVALKMDDVDKAKKWAASPDLKNKMKNAGVTGTPTIDYVTTVMNDATAIQQTVRLLVKHKVKDWDAWKKVFDGDKQARMDAGITDRVLGYTDGDNHNVIIVFAIADMDKAKAFMKSKALMDKMKEGGVEGQPTSFFYKVVQKY